jgi:hypothetical protein
MPRADEITRVRYFERQFLGALDFQAEQQYDRDARRRHVVGHHTWGIIVGFELVEVPVVGETDFVDVIMQTGAAVDGFGRELVAYHPVRLDAASFDAFHTDAHQSVWLAYEEQDEGAARYGFTDCQDSDATRTAEGWRIVVSPTPPEQDEIIVDGVAAATPPAPPGTPEIPDDRSVPYQELPEEPPGDRWLIRLGTVHWDGTQQRFRPAAVGRLNEERRYVGAIVDHLLTPAATLDIRNRKPPTDLDAADFATVEGRLRVKGRINAEKEVWVEGERIRFTYATGDEEGTQLTLGRERPAGNALGHRLRLRLGEPNDDTTWLTIGPGQAGTATDVVRVRASDIVEIPTGTLAFGASTRQMVDLWSSAGGHQYGIGVQASTMYFRTASSFCWFKGGVHSDAMSDPGAGGQLQMRLDDNGNLYFGTRVRQMLNLWSTNYGIGVQDWTMYFRTDADFCWYRNGAHSDSRDDPGGGFRAMLLDDTNHLHVAGKVSTGDDVTVGAGGDAKVVTRHVYGKGSGNDNLDHLYLQWNNGKDVVIGRPGGPTSNLWVSGDLRVDGHAASVIKVVRRELAVQNQGADQPKVWTEHFAGDVDEIYEAFVVLNGFSVTDNTSTAFNNWGRWPDVDTIVQHVFARVSSWSGTDVNLTAFCNQSNINFEANNSMLLTVVVIGRKL